MTKRLTPARVEQLKRSAKRLAREQSIPLNAAQNRLALEQGYANFSLLVKDSRAKNLTEPQPVGVSPVADFESFARDCLECDLNEGHPWRYFNPQSGRFETLEEVLTHLNEMQATNAFLQQLLAPPRTAMKSLCLLQAMYPMRLRWPLRSVQQSAKSNRLRYIERFSSESQRVVELSRDARVRLASGNTDSLIEHVLSHGGIHPSHYYLPRDKESLDKLREPLDSDEHPNKPVDDNELSD